MVPQMAAVISVAPRHKYFILVDSKNVDHAKTKHWKLTEWAHYDTLRKIFLWKKKYQAEIKKTPSSCYEGSQTS
jgi:hypothetical protein